MMVVPCLKVGRWQVKAPPLVRPSTRELCRVCLDGWTDEHRGYAYLRQDGRRGQDK